MLLWWQCRQRTSTTRSGGLHDQSSSASRLTAGAAGFFTFTQCGERPDLYGEPDYSFSEHHSGTCSGHGGVAEWLR